MSVQWFIWLPHLSPNAHRHCHGVRPVQVCREDQRGRGCGEALSEQGHSCPRGAFLFGNGHCRNLPGTSDRSHVSHVVKTSVMECLFPLPTFRKQLWSGLMALERFSSSSLEFFTSSSRLSYHTRPVPLAPPFASIEHAWASPSLPLWLFSRVSFHTSDIHAPYVLTRSLISLVGRSAVICAFFVRGTSLHRHKDDQVCFSFDHMTQINGWNKNQHILWGGINSHFKITPHQRPLLASVGMTRILYIFGQASSLFEPKQHLLSRWYIMFCGLWSPDLI